MRNILKHSRDKKLYLGNKKNTEAYFDRKILHFYKDAAKKNLARILLYIRKTIQKGVRV